MKKINFLLITFFFLLSCAGVKDAGKVLRNEKKNTTDEFLVKKKEPLVMPPEFNKVPEPDTIIRKKELNSEEQKLKKILNSPVSEKTSTSTSTEKSILKKIRK
jgi:hypothetical protein